YLGLSPTYLNGRDRRDDGDAAHRCNIRYFTPEQKKLCIKDDDILQVIARGARKGIQECQYQFRTRRWNCPTKNSTDVFGKVLQIKTRETAFIYAIQAASVMHEVARACAKGELKTCGCDSNIRNQKTDGEFEWGGCSHDINHANLFVSQFVDSTEIKVKAPGQMNLWNNEAGRLAISGEMKLLCKCHGVSGSCSIKVCWRTTDNFRKVGKNLKEKFDGASHVKYSKKKQKFKPRNKFQKLPDKTDLVYIKESPDYCTPNHKTDSLGTKGRLCNSTSQGLDGCQLMCCGRGYYTTVKQVEEDCDCKFIWCCEVKCQRCKYKIQQNFCN
ncbi:protein Wnt-5a-like, partial [Lingula anatina]|uniref:Protein Wnt n=1 Tax=Lingula anatina TaxID=7574 RepID=A0A1S3J7E2_LINAN